MNVCVIAGNEVVGSLYLSSRTYMLNHLFGSEGDELRIRIPIMPTMRCDVGSANDLVVLDKLQSADITVFTGVYLSPRHGMPDLPVVMLSDQDMTSLYKMARTTKFNYDVAEILRNAIHSVSRHKGNGA